MSVTIPVDRTAAPLVMKFGGTSVGDAASMRQVARLVRSALDAPPLVVLSAMAGTTDALFGAGRAAERGGLGEALAGLDALRLRHEEAAAELFAGDPPDAVRAGVAQAFEELGFLVRGVSILKELTPRSLDAVASFGERLSTLLFTELLRAEDVPVHRSDARLVMRTDGRSGAARPLRDQVAALAALHLRPHLVPGRAVVIEGYVGASESGLTTTLGRGGSDYSAALFGAALGAREVQIWTDVEGIMTADPRVVAGALPIERLSFAEAAELAAFGAKVLHPATIQPAVERGIPVTVRHTKRPEGRFTTVTEGGAAGRAVTALAMRGPVTVMTVTSSRMLHQSGFLNRLFEVFGRQGVSVDLVATAEVSVSLTVEADAPVEALREELAAIARVEIATGRSIVAVVGDRLKHTSGLAARAFGALGGINVEMISMGANEINLSMVVRHEDAAEAMRRLHAALVGEGAR